MSVQLGATPNLTARHVVVTSALLPRAGEGAEKTLQDSGRDIPELSIPKASLPKHIGIIMDGNTRWAEQRGLPTLNGHERGVDALRETVRACGAWGVPAITVFAFSTENWRRGSSEVSGLLSLLESTLRKEVPELRRNGVQLRFLGDLSRLPLPLQSAARWAEAETAGGGGLRLGVALSYGARQDVVRAAQELAAEVASGRAAAADITEEAIASRLGSSGMGDVDLLVRTSGERRLSNFLLWEAAYAELWFCDALWPDFTSGELKAAVEDFAGRSRRFGAH
ncbi:unnamed protein product [Pedinophyceae sp. YPF-701]|nr:unnamed protein product [Pedinophyceae sp. YPF-701]